MASLLALIPGVGPAIDRAGEAHVNRLCPNLIPDPASIVDAYRKGTLTDEQMRRGLRSLGYGDTAIDAMLSASKPELSPADLTKAMQRGVIGHEDYLQGMEKLGYTPEEADAIGAAAESVVGPDEALKLKRLGKIDQDEYERILKQNGFSHERMSAWEAANQFQPGPQDLVRFAVREALSPDEAEKLGLYQEIPPAFLEEAKKLGLTEEDAKRYWASHWELPGANQVFDMYHRGLLGEGEEADKAMDDYLKVADYSPAWREKMRGISYNPYTRIDGSRMFLEDEITEDELFKNYKDLGYDDEKAQNLVNYYKQKKAEAAAAEAEKAAKKAQQKAKAGSSGAGKSGQAAKDRDLSISLIKSAYYYSEITRNETEGLLESLNFEPWEAELTLAVWDAELEKKDRQDEQKNLELQYQRGLINESELRTELNKLDLKATAIDTIVLKNTAQKKATKVLPTLADLKRWVKKKLISEDEFINWLLRMNYSEELARLYYLEQFGEV